MVCRVYYILSLGFDHCVNRGKKPRNLGHERDQNLTYPEEKELVRRITVLTISGYPPRYETLRRLAEIIREQHVKKNDDRIMSEWEH